MNEDTSDFVITLHSNATRQHTIHPDLINRYIPLYPLYCSRLNALRVANDRLRRGCVRAHTDRGLSGEFKMALPIVKESDTFFCTE